MPDMAADLSETEPLHLDIDYARRLFADPKAAAAASGDEESARDFLEHVRWPKGVTCPSCGKDTVEFQSNPERRAKRDRRCTSCRHPFSLIAGTPLERSRVGPELIALAAAYATQGTAQCVADALIDAGLNPATARTFALKISSLRERLDRHDFDAESAIDPVGDGEVTSVSIVVDEESSPDDSPQADQVPEHSSSARRARYGIAALIPLMLAVWAMRTNPESSRIAAAAEVDMDVFAPGGEEVRIAHWTSGGDAHTYYTERLAGESVEEWQARHDRKIARLLGLWPKDPE